MANTRVVVVGDGAAGIIISNKIRLLTDRDTVSVSIIGNSRYHYFKPDGIHIPLNLKNYKDSVKPTAFLINAGVEYVKDRVTKIDHTNRKVELQSGKVMEYDILIIATGDRFSTDDVPGYSVFANHFYDLPSSVSLRQKLREFKGGKIVVGQSSIPVQCPPAPYEFTFQLLDYLKSRGIRDKTEVHYIYPLNRVFTMANVAEEVQRLFDEKGVIYHTLFNVESIDGEKRTVNSLEGETVDYDLLVLVPPHKGQQVITDSGLADESGYIDVDRHHLNYADYDDLFAIGDATNLPISKAGATAHFESEYLANRIAYETSGHVYEDAYNGEVACTTVTGEQTAMTLYFSYSKPPRAWYESKFDYLLKWTSADTYFSGMLRGIM
ncbi:MAG: NAD(P)/FAD-dependent oxidoreductase [Candidatus Thermoplasmatota archaeon]|nr:NAD(P)/FAD-dependent oxidoreductase [Candidatus Thermoplasmatota archaeon]